MSPRETVWGSDIHRWARLPTKEMPVLFCLPSYSSPVLFCLSCAVCSVLPLCPVQPVLLCLSHSSCLSCSACHVSAFPVLIVLSWLSCQGSLVLGVLSWLFVYRRTSTKLRARNRGARKFEERERKGAKFEAKKEREELPTGARKREA